MTDSHNPQDTISMMALKWEVLRPTIEAGVIIRAKGAMIAFKAFKAEGFDDDHALILTRDYLANVDRVTGPTPPNKG